MFKILRFFPEDGAGELVGARSRLPATGVAQELCRDIFGAHAFAELCDGLQVPVASGVSGLNVCLKYTMIPDKSAECSDGNKPVFICVF